MTERWEIGLLVLALLCMVVGFILSEYALRRYGSGSAPKGISFNPRKWRLIYLTRDWFTEKKGFWLFIVGMELFCDGPLILIIVAAIRD